MVGTNFGPYRIDEKLGQGGMGVVYKAFDTTLQRTVALKMIQRAHKETVGDASEARFMREARAASRLTHPAIVTIYHFGVEGDTEYIVMEFVEGKSLRKLIHDEPLPLDQFYDIAIQTADGLAAAHEKQIVHRDMKADNVMVTTKGQVKILDFGLAKLKDAVQTATADADGETLFQTQAGLAIGTATHMSPEQAMGREVDGKSDVFSFGVVMYHMLTGKVPFIGPNPTITMARILEAQAEPVRDHNPNVPEALEELVQRTLHKNKMFRPSSQELAEALKALRDSSRVPTGAPAAAAVAAAPSSTGSSGPVVPSPSPQQPGGAPVPVVIVGMQTPQGVQMMPAGAAMAGAAVAVAPEPAKTPSSGGIPIATPPPQPQEPAAFYWPVRATRTVISWALIVVAAVLLLHFLAGGLTGLGAELRKVKLYTGLNDLLMPAVDYGHKLAGGRKLVTDGWDFVVAIYVAIVLVFRPAVVSPLRAWEQKLKRGAR